MTGGTRDDGWHEAAAYETFMGRWSRPLASRFLSWLGLPRGSHWLEVGCGTGALTSAIVEQGSPASLTACDTSPSFVAHCSAAFRRPDVTVLVAGPGALPRHDGGYDAVVSSLVLNFLPDPVSALGEMHELCVPGGCVAACVWDYSDGMEFLRVFWDEAVALDARATAFSEGVRFPLCRPDALHAAFSRARLEDVTVSTLTVPTRFATFDDYWEPFGAGVGPAPSYLTSLDPARRGELESRLRSRLARPGTGSIALSARAWAVRGRRRAG